MAVKWLSTRSDDAAQVPYFIDDHEKSAFGSGPKGRRFKSCHLDAGF